MSDAWDAHASGHRVHPDAACPVHRCNHQDRLVRASGVGPDEPDLYKSDVQALGSQDAPSAHPGGEDPVLQAVPVLPDAPIGRLNQGVAAQRAVQPVAQPEVV